MTSESAITFLILYMDETLLIGNDVEMFSLVKNMVDPLTKLLANLIFNHHLKFAGFFYKGDWLFCL